MISFSVNKGSETEVTRDFVFRREASLWEPPQATIGLQRSTLPDAEGHCCTALFVFYGSNLTYVTVPSKKISNTVTHRRWRSFLIIQ